MLVCIQLLTGLFFSSGRQPEFSRLAPKSLQNKVITLPQNNLIMKHPLLPTFIALCLTATTVTAQKVKSANVPAAVKNALQKKYPSASNVTWEKEKGNFEAN